MKTKKTRLCKKCGLAPCIKTEKIFLKYKSNADLCAYCNATNACIQAVLDDLVLTKEDMETLPKYISFTGDDESYGMAFMQKYKALLQPAQSTS